MPNVKGSALASRVLWVKFNRGLAGVEKLASEASPGLRDIIERGAQKATWYPFELFIELNESIDRLFGAGDGALVREISRHGAVVNLTTIYRLFYRVGTTMWILGRSARLWNAHYDSGRLEVRSPGIRAAELDLIDFATPSCTHCEAVAGWVEQATELSGGTNPVVKRVACRRQGAACCRLRADWQP